MRLVKWSPTINVAKDSPLIPVWISLKQVPIMLYHLEALFEFVKPLGNPLRVDSATTAFTRMERAKVLVEVEVIKTIPESIMVQFKGQDWRIKVSHENLPFFCTFCSKLGHVESSYFNKNPSSKPGNRKSNESSLQEDLEDY